MKEGHYVTAADGDFALVTFVREAIWMGDGIFVYMWDGEKFIGVLGAGTLVQYKAKPGPHVFMGNAENWSYVKADLKAGKQYVVKGNMFPGFTMRVALTPVPNTDERISMWQQKLKAKELPDAEIVAKYVASHKAFTAKAMQEYQDGKVTFAEMTEEHAR
jgi:hypothetical protein